MPRVLPQCVALSAHCPKRTIFTRFVPPASPDQAIGSWRRFYDRWPQSTRDQVDPRLLELMPELAQFAPPALLIDKPVYSAFGGRHLATYLRERQTDTIILSGAETDVCVLATALGAVDAGFFVVLVADAVCSFSDKGHDSLIELFDERFSSQVATARTDEILERWPRE
jgi:nicotinamidase-related amidase